METMFGSGVGVSVSFVGRHVSEGSGDRVGWLVMMVVGCWELLPFLCISKYSC